MTRTQCKHQDEFVTLMVAAAIVLNALAATENIALATTSGWPPPPMAQDDSRQLFAWFAGRCNSRQQVRDALDQNN
jgi:hypothetical protein